MTRSARPVGAWLPSVLLCAACGHAGAPAADAGADGADPSDGRSETTVWLTGCRIVDGLGGVFELRDVEVRDGVIASIAANASVPPGHERIDCAGRTLLPGLINAHAHLFDLDLDGTADSRARWLEETVRPAFASYLRQGVTHVRDVGGPLAELELLAAELAAGSVAGPRLSYCGMPITAPGAHPYRLLEQSGTTYLRDELPQVTAAGELAPLIEDYAARGVSCIKLVYSERTAGAIAQAAVDAAHARGLPITSHNGPPALVAESLALGYDSVEHAVESTDPTALSSLASAFVATGAVLVPTLPAAPNPAGVPVVGTRALYLDGVAIGVGTDGNPGAPKFDAGPFGQMESLTAAGGVGMSNHDAIVAATHRNAVAMGLEDAIGAIAVGKRADALIVTGDPLDDLSVLAAPDLVLLGGRVVVRDGELVE